MKDFDQLLYKDAFIKKSQSKWFRNLEKGHISVLEQIYTLKVTDNNRQLIYNSNNKLIGTKPFVLNFDKDITL
jgi:hypothetical protein